MNLKDFRTDTTTDDHLLPTTTFVCIWVIEERFYYVIYWKKRIKNKIDLFEDYMTPIKPNGTNTLAFPLGVVRGCRREGKGICAVRLNWCHVIFK